MSKKERDNQVDGFDVAFDESVAGADDAAKREDFLNKKKEAAKRFKERRDAEKAERIEGAKKFIEVMQSSGLWDSIPAEQQDYLKNIAEPVKATRSTTNSLFNILFGAEPKVGDSITLLEAFTKSMKAKAQIDAHRKKWAEKGTVVKFVQNTDNMMESTYVIESL